TVNGDTKVESDEAFFVNLSGATNGATISDNLGSGLLQNDDQNPIFSAPTFELSSFAPNTGWFSNDRYPRELADVNHDGAADIVAFGEAGVYVALARGDGSFATPTLQLSSFAPNTGWFSNDRYPR